MKTYIIAEIGINHNARLRNSFKLIDSAVDAGCNCVKFQFFKASNLYLRSAGKLTWQKRKKKEAYHIYSAVKSFELPREWIASLMSYCKDAGVDFLSSVFDKDGAAFLMRSGMKMIKIASTAITNLPLVEYCARYRVPMLLSTGGATLAEIEGAVHTVNKFHNKISLLHSTLKYPAKLNECNLGVIKTLQYAFPDTAIGYSDHTREISIAPVQAVYLGAKIIEKHVTLDKRMEGPDHFFALEPQELKQMVRDIRNAEADLLKGAVKIDKRVYGNTEKILYAHEKYLRDFAFTSLFAKRNIKKGELVRPCDISVLRPGQKKHGLEPRFLRLFQEARITAKKDIVFEAPITWESILS